MPHPPLSSLHQGQKSYLRISGDILAFLVGEIGGGVRGLFLARIVDAWRAGQQDAGRETLEHAPERITWEMANRQFTRAHLFPTQAPVNKT